MPSANRGGQLAGRGAPRNSGATVQCPRPNVEVAETVETVETAEAVDEKGMQHSQTGAIDVAESTHYIPMPPGPQ
jgi:hypothetical protein